MITGSARWYTVGGYLVDAVRVGLSSGVARYGQVPGEIAWDNCTCEGVLAVAVPRVFLCEKFPEEAGENVSARCRAPYEVAELTVSVIRCAPNPDGTEAAPDATDLDAAAGLLLQDLAETMDAVSALLCSLLEADTISDYLITPGEAAGPEGGCVGFTLKVLIALDRL